MALTRTIAVLLFDQVNAIDVTGPTEAFANVIHENGAKAYKIVSWAFDKKIVTSESGLRLCADRCVPKRPIADLLIVPGGKGLRERQTLTCVADWLRRNHAKFGRIASVCTGAYALAEAGIVDGQNITTHWAHADDLQKRYPKVQVNSDSLFLSDGRIHSSGGVTAGIDLALDLIEKDYGGQAAINVAREMVIFLRRSGAQAQFSMPLKMQAEAPNRLSDVCKWAANNLDADLSVEMLASRAGLSARQFSRRFREAFGMPPATYVKRLRLDVGRTLLGQGASVAQAGHAIGFASIDGFRRAFGGQFGIAPGEYQNRFKLRESI